METKWIEFLARPLILISMMLLVSSKFHRPTKLDRDSVKLFIQ